MKKVGKKLSTLIAMTLMLAMMVAMGASAAKQVPEVPIFTEQCEEVPETVGCIHYSESIINTDRSTSLSVYKYSYSGEVTGNGNGHYPPTLPSGATPLEGVVFTYLKVADLVHVNGVPSQVDEEGEKIEDSNVPQVSLQYKLTEQGAAVLDMEPGQYYSDELNQKLKSINGNAEAKKALEEYVAQVGDDMPATNRDGVSTVTGLAQGLYLVAETQVPGAVYEKTNPFFVSLPMTNEATVNIGDGKSYDPGTLWQYDVFVFPKNKMEIPAIEKNIIDNDSEESEKYESLGVGDTVKYEVKTEVPEGFATMSKLSIGDTMSEGLTFKKGSIEVKVEGARGNITDFNVRYDVEKEDQEDQPPYTFVIDFIYEGPEGPVNCFDRSDIKAGATVTITYEATLNENCVITEDGNPNHATLIYNHNAGTEGEGEDQYVEDILDPKVYTYGIEVTKVDKDGTTIPGVEFDLYKEDKVTQIYVSQVDAEDVEEGVITDESKVGTYYPNGLTSGDKITTDANGVAYIWGLAPGTYYLKETKAGEGFTLQKDWIEIKIGEEVTFSAGENGTYVPIEKGVTYYTKKANGTYVAFRDLSEYEDGTYINFGKNPVYTRDQIGEDEDGEPIYEYTEVGTYYYPEVKADIDVADPCGVDGMTVLLKVLNSEGFDLPGTGGMGTYIFTIGGAVILLAALGLILVRRRRNLAR